MRLAALDLATIRPTECERLRRELTRYFHLDGMPRPVGRGDVSGIPIGPLLPKQFTPEDFRKLQGEVRGVFEMLLAFRDGPIPTTKIRGFEIAVRKMVGPGSADSWAPVHVTGGVRDVFLELLFHELASNPNDRIRRCECGNLFFRVKQQKTCSRPCSNRQYWQRYSATRKRLARERQYAKYG